jgi:ABC-2 type transport system permease protein
MVNREQLGAVLWLRWRLTRNQWRRGGSLGAILAATIAAAAIGATILLFTIALLAGLFFGPKWPPVGILAAWDIVAGIFLFTWMIGLLTELQRSETIDLQRLMHLPVALGQIFAINYIASHFVFSIVVSVPVMVGLSVGLALGVSPAMLLLAPLSLAVVFMVTAWTYCLRGWLATMMANPRRRRAIILGITMMFIVISQAPNIYFNVMGKARPRKTAQATSSEEAKKQIEARKQQKRDLQANLLLAHQFVPPFWLPLSARAIAEQKVWPALLSTAGCALIGLAGLRRAYTTTLRFYRGHDKAAKAKRPVDARPEKTGEPAMAKPLLVERRIGSLPDEAAAVALATFRSMLRAPEVKMAWATSLLVTVIFAGTTFLRAGTRAPAEYRPFMVIGMLSMTLFMLVQSLANHFGFDRGGFRAFVLAPISRRQLLLGKNLATVPIAAVVGGLVGGVGAVWLGLTPTAAISIPFQFLTMFLLACILGNALSIYFPYKVQQGSMKPTKMPAKAALMMFVTHMFFPFVMLPAFAPPVAQLLWNMGKLPPVPVGLILSVGLATAAGAAYWLSLGPFGRLLQERELKILEVLASDVE